MAQQRLTLEFDLYFDETGQFLETSNVPAERKEGNRDKFPSLLAGFLVPRGDIQTEAKAVISNCKEKARLRPLETFKGSSLTLQQLGRFVRQLVAEFRERPNWELVRIVNQEAVCYGDRVSAYTNIFAELLLRLFQEKSIEHPDANISIRPLGTTVMLNQGKTPMPKEEYGKRVHEYVKFLAVRRGLAVESNRWTPEQPVLNIGRERPELLIADLLCNASHDDFRKLDYSAPRRRSEVSNALVAAFGERNWTMTVRELFERVSMLCEEYSFGMALIAIAETLGSQASLKDYDPVFVGKAQEHTANINRQLAHMGARGRDPQLATVLNWLDQIVGHQRLAERGYRLAQWLLINVADPLRRELRSEVERETIDWFEYGLRRWALTAANHDGKLFDGEKEVQAMRLLSRSLARQWERAPILFDGLIAQAVHLTDAFEFDRVGNDMRLVAQSLETQSDLFSNYQAGAFPDPIKFDLRAKAIGTLVQTEMLKGFTSVERLQATRELSDAAIAEFSDPKDRARQYQYRCHLETIAGNFTAARRYLIWSIRKAETAEPDLSHAAIARLIVEPTDDPPWLQDFTVSHWLRLGARICLQESPERESFIGAYDNSRLFKAYDSNPSTWSDFPIHNILRFLAVIEASQKRFDPALAALERLHNLDPIGKTEFVMATILCACQAEVAALFLSVDPATTRSMLDSEGERLNGLIQLLHKMKELVGKFPRINELITSWEQKIVALLGGNLVSEAAKETLLEIGGEIRY
jgi:hypothetical protein